MLGKLLEPTLAIFYDPDQNFLGCKRPKIEKKFLQSGCTFIISYCTIKTNAQIAPIAQWILADCGLGFESQAQRLGRYTVFDNSLMHIA